MVLISRIRKVWDEEPLTLILFLAILFRLIATIFAKGWGMLDDHFLVIESAQSWVDGEDYNDWLPGSPRNTGPTGHNFFYPGLHFLIFSVFKVIHLYDPQVKMFIIRLIHAGWSLITVVYGYKITEKISDRNSARLTGLLLAILWFMPWVSVRNLAEVVNIPLLMFAIWLIIGKNRNGSPLSLFFLTGILLGLAFNIRIQTVFFSIGLGFALLLKKEWKGAGMMLVGALVPILIIQGLIDLFIWGKPYVELAGYIKGNILSAESYITMPWYNYFLVVVGMLVPPVSLFLFFGYLRCWRKHLILFLPVALFFIFHSAFPNKQERFILPVMPFIIMVGVIGWRSFTERSIFWLKRKNFLKGCWIFFWVINIAALLVVSVVYSKRARVETMIYLSRYTDIKQILVADAGNSPELFPRFYLGQWPHVYDELPGRETTDSLLIRASKEPFSKQPRFILFSTEHDLQAEILKARKSFPFIVYETTIKPGFIDRLVRWLNPINKNRTVYIYRNTIFFRTRIERH